MGKRELIMASRRRRERAEAMELPIDLAIAAGLLLLGFIYGPWQLGVLFGGGLLLVVVLTEPSIRKNRLARKRR